MNFNSKYFAFLLIFFIGFCQSRVLRPIAEFSNRSHIGHWSGRDHSARGKIFLYSNGFAFFSVMGRSFGGPRLNPNGALLYQINYSSHPIELDLVGVDSEYKELRRIKMIVEFLNTKQMRVCTYMTDVRPKSFDSLSPCRTILLHKTK